MSKQQTLANGGAICGGVVKESEYKEATKKDVWAYAMSYVMPDEWFEVYVMVKNLGDDKLATKIFDEHSWSMI